MFDNFFPISDFELFYFVKLLFFKMHILDRARKLYSKVFSRKLKNNENAFAIFIQRQIMKYQLNLIKAYISCRTFKT